MFTCIRIYYMNYKIYILVFLNFILCVSSLVNILSSTDLWIKDFSNNFYEYELYDCDKNVSIKV